MNCAAGSVGHDRIGTVIRAATEEVFSTMLGLAAMPGSFEVRNTPGGTRSGVTTLLGLTGDWVGSGQLSCEPPLACRIASAMLMAEYDAVDDDVLDAIAEVANMIIGNVKNLLEGDLGPMGLSTPAVVFGGEFETRTPGNPDWVLVPFDCSGETLTVQVVLAPNTASGVKRSLGAVREAELVPVA